MRTKETVEYDPLRDFFTKEWESPSEKEEIFAAFRNDVYPAAADFSAKVIKKIVENRRKEWLFNAACIALAAACIISLALFVYPGYKQIFSIDFSAVAAGVWERARFFFDGVQQRGGALIEHSLAPLRRSNYSVALPENPYLLGLIVYLVLLAVALLGIDRVVKKVRPI